VRWGLWVAFVLTLVVWIWSAWFGALWSGPRLLVGVFSGVLVYADGLAGLQGYTFDVWRTPDDFIWGFRWEAMRDAARLEVPLWVPALFLGLTAAWMERRRRRRARDPSLCECGYPVAGLGRCPECGAEVAAR
jgi:hypothetical protein